MYKRIQDETSVEISGRAEAGQGGGKGAKQGGTGGIKVSDKHEKETRTRKVFSCLTQGGFTFLPHGHVTPFAVETSDRLMYISVHDGSKSWGRPRVYFVHNGLVLTIYEAGKGSFSRSGVRPQQKMNRHSLQVKNRVVLTKGFGSEGALPF